MVDWSILVDFLPRKSAHFFDVVVVVKRSSGDGSVAATRGNHSL